MSRTAVIAGIGGTVPPYLVTNDELAQRLDTSDDWIRSRTGIEQRYFVQDGISTGDLAVEAGLRALKNAGLDSVGLVLLATTTPDRPCPATAPSVASRMGMVGVPAMDISAVCSGFVYALQAASSAIVSGFAETVLVIAAETFSTIINPQDRTTGVIFGDGAGALALRAGTRSESGAVLAFDCGSDGSLADLITVRAGGSEQRSQGWAPGPADLYFHMEGKAVFSSAVRHMTESSQNVLRKTGWTVDSVDKFVGHQANKRILRSVAECIGIAEGKAVVNIENVGNTAGASIPLALVENAAEGALHAGDRVLITAFGGGATWGSATFTWPDLKLPDNYNYNLEGTQS